MARLSVAPVLLLLAFPLTARAQNVRGVVVEQGSDTPIALAAVDLLSADSAVVASAVTDSSGWFQLTLKTGGQFTVRASHPSYTASRADTVSVSAREIVTIRISMARSAIPLEPLVVTARSRDRLAGFRERSEGHGFGRYIKREDIEARPAARVTDLMQVMPGVRIVPVARTRGSAFTTNMIMMRGTTGMCLANVYLDGVPLRQYPDVGIDDMLTADMLEGAEIYASSVGAPAEFMTPMNSCGVVALWTRTGGGRPFTWKRLLLGLGVVGILLLITQL